MVMRYENDPRICAHCRWMVSRDVTVSSGEVVRVNQCRRNAPLVTGGLHTPIETAWPKVALNDWCGDFAEEEPRF